MNMGHHLQFLQCYNSCNVDNSCDVENNGHGNNSGNNSDDGIDDGVMVSITNDD